MIEWQAILDVFAATLNIIKLVMNLAIRGRERNQDALVEQRKIRPETTAVFLRDIDMLLGEPKRQWSESLVAELERTIASNPPMDQRELTLLRNHLAHARTLDVTSDRLKNNLPPLEKLIQRPGRINRRRRPHTHSQLIGRSHPLADYTDEMDDVEEDAIADGRWENRREKIDLVISIIKRQILRISLTKSSRKRIE